LQRTITASNTTSAKSSVPAVFGYVYVDANRNHRFDQGETGIPNTLITISGTAFTGTPMATR